MKIFVVILMLFVVKGIETRALPDERGNADGWNSKGWVINETFLAPFKPIMEIQNVSTIFENAMENVTPLTRELQQKMETFGINVKEQADIIKEKMTSLFGQFQGTIEDTSKQSELLSFVEQLKMLEKNISQWNLNTMPINSNQTFEEKWQQDLNQQMEKFQKIFNPLIGLFQGTITEGVENLRKSISPGVHEIRKLISESEV
ncbi:uncharacterized protein [Heptranchias perlo]|uniref:uncharacterized protein n=1 Tax=Heptranchias perlo TaxID=212740 RepID=UPI00355937D3